LWVFNTLIRTLLVFEMYAEKFSPACAHRRLHLGHYHGVLANWIKLQHEYPCLFFVADWHALTTLRRAGHDYQQRQ